MQTIKSSTVAISSNPVKRAGSEISSVCLLLDARPKASRTSLLSLCSRIDNRLCLAATVVRFHFISSFYFWLLSSYILLLLLYYYFTLLKLFPARRHSFTPAQSPSPSASASASPWTTIFSFIFCSSRLVLFELNLLLLLFHPSFQQASSRANCSTGPSVLCSPSSQRDAPSPTCLLPLHELSFLLLYFFFFLSAS